MKIRILALSVFCLSILSACWNESDFSVKQPETLTLAEQSSKMEESDNNQNGIRDDIDAYIQKNFTDANQQNSVKRFAKSMQEFLLVNPDDREAAKAASIKNSKAISCIYLRFPADNAYEIVNDLDAITTNTKKRLLASIAVDKALDGTVISEQHEDVCDE